MVSESSSASVAVPLQLRTESVSAVLGEMLTLLTVGVVLLMMMESDPLSVPVLPSSMETAHWISSVGVAMLESSTKVSVAPSAAPVVTLVHA